MTLMGVKLVHLTRFRGIYCSRRDDYKSMDDDDFINKAIGRVIVHPDEGRYYIAAGVRIDHNYLLAISLTGSDEITVFIADMNDNGQLLADKYKGRNYDDIYDVLWDKFTGIRHNV